MNVRKINNLAFDWMETWKGIAEKHLANKTLKQGSGDQGILNAFFYEHPELVLQLPCSWNYQVGRAADCDSETMFPILHFNHPDKMEFLLKDFWPLMVSNQITETYRRVVQINGYSVRRLFSECVPKREKYAQDISTVGYSCGEPIGKVKKTHRIFPNFFASRDETYMTTSITNKTSEPSCLVTHLDFDKISQLELLCHRWDSNISAAIYLDDSEMVDLIRIISNNSKCISNPKVQFHLVHRNGPIYPAFLMQNIALKYAPTAQLLFVDSAFLPSGGPNSFFC